MEIFEQTSLTNFEIEDLKAPFQVKGNDQYELLSIDGTKWTYDFVKERYELLYPNGEDEELTIQEIETILNCTTQEQQVALGITIIGKPTETPLDPFDDMPVNMS